jgi:DNA-binding transcriptional regulator YiaG
VWLVTGWEFNPLVKTGQGERTLKDCPDLAAMTGAQKADFWTQNDPRELRRLGDRLLAESLPHEEGEEAAPRELLSQQAAEKRASGGWSRADVAKLLGVTESMLEAWETDRVKTPGSLPLLLERMSALKVTFE